MNYSPDWYKKLFFGLLVLCLFVRCSDEDDTPSLARDYFLGEWEAEWASPFGNELRFRFEEDNRYTIITTGFAIPEGIWSYNEQDRELLITGSDGLDTYTILNFTDNRFEALKEEDKRILFFTRVP